MESNEAREPLWFQLLRAAGSFADRFTKQELAVRAWKMAPRSFGLAGFEDRHPDANAVNAKLYGSAGIVGRGFVEACNGSTFRVTGEGRRTLAFGPPTTPPRPARTRPVTVSRVMPQPLVEVFARTPHTTTLGRRFIGVPR